ncbi:glutaredoxin family protein [Acetivibrio straminisolvens]|jgi:glutaredoxin-like YruB-family protein|uniref:Glutaredoxin n=1 Tax=Acetivibrio straminisolvens JCM 21531 TaxID=1294263 RepID=W4V173_9FIRM|nr:Uxx-star family glutaredoxin-like (seleno)protein [Acetivibrio straminisolvens]GAE86961.1 glutaredoxin [Acetivibrio straminisolvens JCM 21531]
MDVIVYTTPTCPWCTRVKEYLDQKGVEYREINVASDRNAAMEMIQKSGQRGVPVVDINGNIVVGFDQGRIDSLIGN